MRRKLSLLLCLTLLASCLSVAAFAADDSTDYGWSEMEGDFAFRVTQNGGEVARLMVGETYQLQLWLQDVGPYAISVPLAWDPAVVEVVDGGEAVPSGKKSAGEAAGFRAGSKCYETGYDPMTYEPLYWNGRPVYTTNDESPESGYPYLNAEAGFYKFFYYVSSPSVPANAQLILEVNFEAVGSGDPDFHIATRADGAGCYDPASPSGMSVLLPGGDEEDMTEVYDEVSCPTVRALTQAEADEEAAQGITGGMTNDVSSGSSGSSSSGNSGATVNPAPAVTATLIAAEHLTCFPYDTAAETAAVLRNVDGEVTDDSDYILPSSLVADAVNAQSGKTALLARMPDQILRKSDYTVRFELSNIDDMANNGLGMLYFETPWAFIGLNTTILAAQTDDNAVAELTAAPYGIGVQASLTIDGKAVGGFDGLALRVILPWTEGSLMGTAVVLGSDVFGSGIADQPLGLSAVDDEHGALIFLSPSFCGFDVAIGDGDSFTDLAGVAWAEDSIAELAARQVLSGIGGGKFNPTGAVTREQFAKMLVCAFGMYTSGTTGAVFTDVADASQWYYPYVASAKNAGLVGGIGGGRFGTGAKITRQDLCVMLVRAADSLGITLPETIEAPSFTDGGAIADYASDAVSALYRAGIINGVGDGRFDPSGTATRAQAAKMLCGVLQLALDTV